MEYEAPLSIPLHVWQEQQSFSHGEKPDACEKRLQDDRWQQGRHTPRIQRRHRGKIRRNQGPHATMVPVALAGKDDLGTGLATIHLGSRLGSRKSSRMLPSIYHCIYIPQVGGFRCKNIIYLSHIICAAGTECGDEERGFF